MTLRVTWAEFDTAVTVAGNYLAATETGSDTAAFAGNVTSNGVSGSLSASESGADTASFAGDVIVKGALSVSESGSDTAVFAGDVYVSGVLAATESGADTAIFVGSGATPPVVGSFDILEAGTDSISLSGKILITGGLSVSETGSDTANITNVTATTILTAADLAAIDALLVARIPDIAAAILAAAQVTPIYSSPQGPVLDLAKINGVVPGTDAVVSDAGRTAGDVTQTFTDVAGTVTIART